MSLCLSLLTDSSVNVLDKDLLHNVQNKLSSNGKYNFASFPSILERVLQVIFCCLRYGLFDISAECLNSAP